MSRYGGRAIFIGNLPEGTRERDLEDLFGKFGRIRMVDIKTPPRPPAFAFLEYDDPRDAQEAARRRNGIDFNGSRIRVEVARGGEPQPAIRNSYVPPRNSMGYRVLVKGLPQSASWQDLKDHFRRVVKPLYTETYRDRNEGLIGVVEFENSDDLRLAIRKLDDTEFKNPFDKGSYVRLVDDSDNARRDDRGRGYSDRGRDGDRGRDRDRRDSRRDRSRSISDRSKSRSPVSRSRSPASRSASPKDRRSVSRSPVRSVSRSPPPRKDASDDDKSPRNDDD